MKPPAQLGIGTATFLQGYGLGAATPAVEQAADLVRRAVDAGIRYVDTAASYGDGERVLGLLASVLEHHHVRVCTKISGAADQFAAALTASLDRLRLSRVDTVMLHSADEQGLAAEATGAALRRLVEDAMADRAGASTYGPDSARLAATLPWCRALQVEHSILNQSVMRNLPQEHGAEIIARSVLCKGLLTARRAHAPGISAPLEATIAALESVAAGWGFSLPALAIRFALDTPGVAVVLVGVSTLAELDDALAAAARAPLDPEQLAQLATFDRSMLDATHPERWGALGPAAA